MAEELKIKVRVDSSDVSRGTDEAKSKVQQAADAMKKSVADSASSMKQSTADASANMKHSMESVAKSTESIGDAAKSAENAVKEMDRGVAKSAANMERNLSSVRRQMGAMQAFHMGTRAVGMTAGVAKNVAILTGNKDAVESIDATAGVLTGGIQGAAMGWAFTGGNPIGAAVGGLVGAGAALLDVAAKQKEAAEKQMEAAKASIEQSKLAIELIDQDYRSRERVKMIQDLVSRERGYGRNTAGKLDIDFAQGEIDLAKTSLLEAEKRQQRIQDMIYGRNGIPTQIEDWNKVLGDIKKIEVDGVEYDISGFDLPKTTGVIDWMAPGAAEAIARLFAEAFRTEDSKNWEALAMEYAAAGLPPPVHPAQLKAEDFDEKITAEIASKVLDSLRKMAIEADIAVTEAQRVLSEFEPLQARINKERAADEARLNAPLNFNDDEWGIEDIEDQSEFEAALAEMAARDLKKATKDKITSRLAELSSGESIVKGLSARLSGLANFATSPTDALTKIGGGVGYTSYNNSVLTVTKSIEKSLNTLIANQLRQNEEIKEEIANLKFLEATWQ